MMLAFIAAVTFIGWNILYLISARAEGICLLERLFISYGMGMGFVSMGMLFFYFLGGEFSASRILSPWLLLIALNIVLYFKRARGGPPVMTEVRSGDNRPLAIFLTVGLTLEILYSLFRALIKPMEAYDAVAIYGVKAKMFYLADAIPKGFFNGVYARFPHPDYPLNIPLSETLAYIFMGGLNDQLVKLIFPLFFIGILTILYFGIRRFAGKTYALLFTFLLATVSQFNEYATNAYLDLALAYYYFASAVFLYIWFENKEKVHFLLISAFMVSLAAWTKNEGLMYCLINIGVLFIFFLRHRPEISKTTRLCMLSYPCIVLAVTLPWLYVKASANIMNSDLGAITPGSLNIFKYGYKIPPIFYEFQKQFFGPKKWNLVWPAALFVSAINFKKLFRGVQGYITLSLALALAGYISVYMIAIVDIRYFLRTSWSRFIIHFLPVVIYGMARILKEDLDL